MGLGKGALEMAFSIELLQLLLLSWLLRLIFLEEVQEERQIKEIR